jgi:hypothetical protein
MTDPTPEAALRKALMNALDGTTCRLYDGRPWSREYLVNSVLKDERVRAALSVSLSGSPLMASSEPGTEAGRTLSAWWASKLDGEPPHGMRAAILAIEAEARSSLLAAVRERLGPKRRDSSRITSDIDAGWNDCRDFVLRFLDTLSDRGPTDG